MPWSVTEIEICGFPRYACGHKYILISDHKGNVYLGHLGIANKNVPPILYWSLFLTWGLTACIRLETDPEKIQKLFSLALFSKCSMRVVDDEVGEKLLQKIQEQSGQKKNKPYAEPFFLYGQKFWSKGGNCQDWAEDLLKEVKKKAAGPIEITDLIEGLARQKNLSNR